VLTIRQHLVMAMNILYERADSPSPSKSDILDRYAQVMLTRMECLCALFLEPAIPIDDSDVMAEPVEPILPQALSNLQQAQALFFGICRYRHSYSSRMGVWTSANAHFWHVRKLFLRWSDLIVAYRMRMSCEDKSEYQRAAAMAFQFSTIFAAFIYSVRTDLHMMGRQLRPKEVLLKASDRVTMLIEFPDRYIQLAKGGCPDGWDPGRGADPFNVGLWPAADVLSMTGEGAIVAFGFD
jgi:hypothetical protein